MENNEEQDEEYRKNELRKRLNHLLIGTKIKTFRNQNDKWDRIFTKEDSCHLSTWVMDPKTGISRQVFPTFWDFVQKFDDFDIVEV